MPILYRENNCVGKEKDATTSTKQPYGASPDMVMG